MYAWVAEFHKEWLRPKPKGFIPDLNDVADLIWIERKLAEKGLTKQTRAELETMRKAALDGSLRDDDLESWQKRGRRSDDGMKSFLSTVRAVRKRGSRLDKVPAEVIALFDTAIELLRKAMIAGSKQDRGAVESRFPA